MRRISLLVSIAVLLPGTAATQSIPSPYRYIEQSQTVTLFGGYLNNSTGTYDVAPESAPMVGARYNIRFAGPLSGEVGLAFLPSKRTIYARAVDGSGGLTAVDEADAPLVMGEAGFRFQITGPRTWHGLAPYVTATGGLMMNTAGRTEEEKELPEDQRIDFGPAFAVGLSAGTDWFITERISIRAAGQGYLTRIGVPEGLVGRADSEWVRSLGGTLGIALHF